MNWIERTHNWVDALPEPLVEESNKKYFERAFPIMKEGLYAIAKDANELPLQKAQYLKYKEFVSYVEKMHTTPKQRCIAVLNNFLKNYIQAETPLHAIGVIVFLTPVVDHFFKEYENECAAIKG